MGLIGWIGKMLSIVVQNRELRAENSELRALCEEKDAFFMELMSDAMRHGSPLGAKHMAERRGYLNGK